MGGIPEKIPDEQNKGKNGGREVGKKKNVVRTTSRNSHPGKQHKGNKSREKEQENQSRRLKDDCEVNSENHKSAEDPD